MQVAPPHAPSLLLFLGLGEPLHSEHMPLSPCDPSSLPGRLPYSHPSSPHLPVRCNSGLCSCGWWPYLSSAGAPCWAEGPWTSFSCERILENGNSGCLRISNPNMTGHPAPWWLLMSLPAGLESKDDFLPLSWNPLPSTTVGSSPPPYLLCWEGRHFGGAIRAVGSHRPGGSTVTSSRKASKAARRS